MLRLALSTTALALLPVGTALAQSVPAATAPGSPATGDDQPADDAVAPAAVEPTGGIEDIVVTAQRRAERVQDVPIAISAFSARQLEAQGVSNTLQLGNFVPNLVAQNNTGIGSANAYFLRGLGSTETIATFDPPVGTYVDDIYLSRQNANNLSMFDVERIEVLRGPQGTLFGRNTTGGAINVILAQPGEQWGGFVEAGIGSYEKFVVRGSLDIPLSDDFGAKVSGYIQNDRGYVRNNVTNDWLNDDDGYGARLGLRARVSQAIAWSGSAMRVVSKGDNLLNFRCDPRNPADCDGRFASTGLREGVTPAWPAGLITGRKARFSLGQKARSDIFISKFDVGLTEQLNLSLITGFVDLAQTFVYDFADGRSAPFAIFPSIAVPRPVASGNPLGGYNIINDGTHRQFSQEVKLTGGLGDRIKYITGLYYLKERNRTELADFSVGFGGLLGDRLLRNTTTAFAAYAQADVEIIKALTATVGVRWTDETKRLDISDNRAACQLRPVPGNCVDNANLVALNGVPIPRKLNTRIWTPRFALNYKPSTDLLLFTSATRGFKSGGWNARETSARRFLPFDPEKVWSYEAGFKSDFMGNRLRLNMTAFQLDVSDLQVLGGVLSATGSASFITRNFADYRNRGLEIEFSARPVDGLNLFANAGLQKDKYRGIGGRPAADTYGVPSVAVQRAACLAALAAGNVGTRVPVGGLVSNCGNGIVTAQGEIATPVRTPSFTLATGGSYRMMVGGGWSVTPALNGTYRNRQEVAIANVSLYDAPIVAPNCPGGTCAANPNGNGNFLSGSNSPGGWLINSGITLGTPGDRMSITAECVNCFDKTLIQSSLFNYSYLNQPRSWMVRAKVRFGE